MVVASELWVDIFRWLQVQPYEGIDPVEVLRWCDMARMGATSRVVLEVVPLKTSSSSFLTDHFSTSPPIGSRCPLRESLEELIFILGGLEGETKDHHNQQANSHPHLEDLNRTSTLSSTFSLPLHHPLLPPLHEIFPFHHDSCLLTAFRLLIITRVLKMVIIASSNITWNLIRRSELCVTFNLFLFQDILNDSNSKLRPRGVVTTKHFSSDVMSVPSKYH
ncbi:hypothetical protein LXL04_003035 [Taraxacum kok-saghyz]